MKEEDKKIITAAVQFVKAYRRWQIEGIEDPLVLDELKERAKDVVAAVDEKYDPTEKDDGLVPPDLERCQAEFQEGSFMTFGPRPRVRCPCKPTFIAKENKPGPDGKRGSMSLCYNCVKVFEKNMGEGHSTLTPIKPEIKWEPESHWDEHPNWPIKDWEHEIGEGSTRQGYHEWIRSKISELQEREADE